MMPIADFAGAFGWGYDGVDLYAPTRLYGTPGRPARASSIARTRSGSRVILDVVYNHLGPDGNYLERLLDATTSPTSTRTTGARRSTSRARPPARAFFVENAGYWIDEFHFDGLRLDATQDIKDASPEHVLADDRRGARARRPARAPIYLVAENEPQHTRDRARARMRGGYGLDALWNDDYPPHRAGRADRRAARRTTPTTRARAQEFVSAREVRLPLSGPALRVAGAARAARRRSTCPAQRSSPSSRTTIRSRTARSGKRLHQLTSPGTLRALTALTAARPGDADAVSGPGVRLVARRSCIFADHSRELASRGRDGPRASSSTQFPSIDGPRRPDAPARPRATRDVRALQARSRPSASGTPRPTRCTATCWRCAATTR